MNVNTIDTTILNNDNRLQTISSTTTSTSIESTIVNRVVQTFHDQSAALFMGILIGIWVVYVYLKIPEKFEEILDLLRDIKSKG